MNDNNSNMKTLAFYKKEIIQVSLAILFSTASLFMVVHYSSYIYSGIYIYLEHNQQWLEEYPIPCYEEGMAAYHSLGYPVRSDGLLYPRLFLTKEKRALELLLADIERYGINTEECKFFVVGPVYGLYESLGRWSEAKEFLTFAKQFYSDTSREYLLIAGLLEAIEDRHDRPLIFRFTIKFLAYIDGLLRWYAPLVFCITVILALVFTILSLLNVLRLKKNMQLKISMKK